MWSEVGEASALRTSRFLGLRVAFWKKKPRWRLSEFKPVVIGANDPQFDAITRDQLIDFLAWLRDGYVSDPDGVAPRGQIRLSPKSILNIHTDLSAFWTWGVAGQCVATNIARSSDPPVAKAPADRYRAIIMLLVDSGLRTPELCNIKVADINLSAKSIRVLGKGHASRERLIYFGKRTAKRCGST